MRASLPALPLILFQSFTLPHGDIVLAVMRGNDNAVGIMHDAVADGIGQSRLTNLLMPAAYIKLGAEDGGRPLISGLCNLQ